MILSTSERTTFLSIEIQTLTFFIANDMVCTFSRSSHTNSTCPRLLSKDPSNSLLIAMWENWYWVLFALSSGLSPVRRRCALRSPFGPTTPTNLMYGLILATLPQTDSQSFLFNDQLCGGAVLTISGRPARGRAARHAPRTAILPSRYTA